MPCVKGSLRKRQIFLPVGIMHPQKIEEKITQGINLTQNDMYRTLALVDTGATHSCITKRLANDINLLPDGKIRVHGAHGEKDVPFYVIALAIPEIGFFESGITVSEVLFHKDGECQAIIGMDILCKGTFQFDISGNFVFCV